jgi:hypothetical protein
MRAAPWALAAVLACGCSTVVPMQTASAVDRGGLRVGGQLSASGFCGSIPGGVLGLAQCTEHPDGVPLPELRADARYGFAKGADVGASVQVQGMVAAPERSLQLGLTADLKAELLRVATSGPTHVVSAGVLGGMAAAGRLGLPWWSQFEWSVPFFYGLQFQRWELVFGAQVSQRATRSPNVEPSTDTVRAGFTVGLFHRNPTGIGLQLGYLANPRRFGAGSWQLQVGTFFDLL